MSNGFQAAVSGEERLQEAAERLIDLQHRAEMGLPHEPPPALQLWLADGANEIAYNDIASTLRAARGCVRPRPSTEAERAADEFDGSMSVREWLKRERRVAAPPPLRRPLADRLEALFPRIAVGSILALAVTVLAIYCFTKSATESVAVYETAAGKQRLVRMQDGSIITLGARTKLTAHYSRQRRTVVLNEGEASFSVEHDPQRPFVVLAGGGSIEAVGTAFNVLLYQDQVDVTVSEGAIEVAPRVASLDDPGTVTAPSAGRQPLISTKVARGQKVTYVARGGASRVESADLGMAASRQTGYLKYRSEPLRHVIMDVNRYWSRQIFLDHAAGELLYTGEVTKNGIDGWVHGLPQIFALDIVDEEPAYLWIRSRKDPLPGNVH